MAALFCILDIGYRYADYLFSLIMKTSDLHDLGRYYYNFQYVMDMDYRTLYYYFSFTYGFLQPAYNQYMLREIAIQCICMLSGGFGDPCQTQGYPCSALSAQR
jgi:hypothetical protein